MNKPGAIILESGNRSRYKIEIFPRIFLKSDKPSLWARIGYFLLLGKRVIKLPDIETCQHTFVKNEIQYHKTGETLWENFCTRCELEEPILNV